MKKWLCILASVVAMVAMGNSVPLPMAAPFFSAKPPVSSGGGGPTFPSGSVGDWKFNGDLTDSSGNGNTLTMNGAAASYTTNKQGVATHALNFNGSDQHADSATAAVGRITVDTYTVSVWVAPVSSISGGPVVISHGSFAGTGYYLQIASDGHIEWHVAKASAPSDAAVKTAAGAITLAVWHNIIVTGNGTTGKIYVDGTDATSTSDSMFAPDSDNNVLKIGAYSSNGNLFQGIIDEPAIWLRTITAQEITDIQTLGPQ